MSKGDHGFSENSRIGRHMEDDLKQMTITYPHLTQSVTIDDDEKALGAYAALKKAMDEYKEYGNDREKTIELDLGPSGTTTIRIAAVAAVHVYDLHGIEETFVKKEVWGRRLDAKVTAALQPAAE